MANPIYKSSSLLSLYLTETPVSDEQNVPEIHIHGDNPGSDSYARGSSQNNGRSSSIDGHKSSDNGRQSHSSTQSPVQTLNSTDQGVPSPASTMRSSSRVSYLRMGPGGPKRGGLSPKGESQESGATLGREISRNSFGGTSAHTSTMSTVNSLYSSINTFSDEEDDLDFQSIQVNLEALDLESKKSNSKYPFKGLLRKKEEKKTPLTKDEVFFLQIQERLMKQNFFYDKKSTLDINWLESCEIFLFGSTLDDIFPSEAELLNYLLQSSYELGEVRFSNLSRYHDIKNTQPPVEQLLRELLPNLARFSKVLDLYAESKKNMNSPELFEVFSNYANNINGGLCLPLAISMFGNWLLTFNKDSTLSSNYENTLILDYFRKAGRLALVVRKCKPAFEKVISSFNKNEIFELSRYYGKDNQNSLSVSLHGLGEYYQYINEYDIATTLWEINCHLTSDIESGNLAVLGLTDGFGYGNRIKHRNRLGKKSKTDRYNTKRRIAQVYRILMKNPNFDEYGVSWATKSKYD